jgi:hypothetical protein
VIISVPVWGDWHSHLFRMVSYPSYQHQLGPDDRLIIHGTRFPDIEAEYHPLDVKTDDHAKSALGHRDAITRANGGPVVFIPPDCAVSAGALDAIRRRLGEGKRFIALCSIRANRNAPRPPGFDPRSLIDWALKHPHEITKRSTWGNKDSLSQLSINLFPTECGAVARCYHLHPILIQTENANFSGTIDDELPNRFSPEEIHIVTDSDEMAMVELTPDSRQLSLYAKPPSVDRIKDFARHVGPTNRYFFTQRIVLKARDGSDFHEIEKDL